MNKPKFVTLIMDVLETDRSIVVCFVEFHEENPKVRILCEHFLNMSVNKEQDAINSSMVLNFPLSLDKSYAFSIGI